MDPVRGGGAALAAATVYLGVGLGLTQAALVVTASPMLGPYAPVRTPGDLAFGFPFVGAAGIGAAAPGNRTALAATLAMALAAGAGIAAVFLAPAGLGYTPERGAALNLAVQQGLAGAAVTLLTGIPGLVVGLLIGSFRRQRG